MAEETTKKLAEIKIKVWQYE